MWNDLWHSKSMGNSKPLSLKGCYIGFLWMLISLNAMTSSLVLHRKSLDILLFLYLSSCLVVVHKFMLVVVSVGCHCLLRLMTRNWWSSNFEQTFFGSGSLGDAIGCPPALICCCTHHICGMPEHLFNVGIMWFCMLFFAAVTETHITLVFSWMDYGNFFAFVTSCCQLWMIWSTLFW